MINILVCDDDKDIVDAIEIYLAPEGYRILKAYDGIQAIEMMRKNDIQLLIMDVMMPRMDGIRHHPGPPALDAHARHPAKIGVADRRLCLFRCTRGRQ